MVASLTTLPVIGVPIKTSTLNGQDSLLSIVQMPSGTHSLTHSNIYNHPLIVCIGIPVATVAIGNATNAGLLAARMLGRNHSMCEFMNKQEEVGLKFTSSLIYY